METKIISIFLATAFLSLSLQVNCELTSSSVDETPVNQTCPEAEPLRSSILWAHTPRNYYFPLGSQHFYRYWAEAFLGRSPNNQTELDDISMTVSYFGGVAIIVGFKSKTIHWTCVPLISSLEQVTLGRVSQFKCSAVAQTSDTNVTSLADTILTWNWTDGESCVLLTFCYLNGKVYDWGVLSVNKVLAAKHSTEILKKVEKLGFSASKQEAIQYQTSLPISEFQFPFINGGPPLLTSLTG